MTETVKRTPDQEQAVTLRGSDLLVSASAGSGKTKVLVDRIIHRLTTDPAASLSKMLIVTFTNAATAEMKLKIETKLRERLAAGNLTPTQRQHLATEVAQASAANIMTLDAFSKQVVDHYYYVIDLDPGYRMMTDESEVLLFKTRVWQDLRANIMSHPDKAAAFETLAANFATKATRDGLQDVVFALYDYAMTTKDPQAYLAQIAAAYDDRDESWMTDVWAAAKPVIAQSQQQLEAASRLVAGDPLMAPWQASLDQTKTAVAALLALVQPTYQGAYEAYHAVTYPSWKVSTAKKFAEVKPTIADAKRLRDQAKTALDDLASWFEILPADLEAAMPKALAVAQTLQATMLEYDRAMRAEKAARRVQTFGDIAQNALQILNAPLNEGSAQTVGDHYKHQFQEVLIDEYQDINPLQDALLDAVSTTDPGDRFMVGDMKQSIYGFRLADPQKFLTRYHQYSQPDAAGRLVTLNQNFRSTSNVLAFTNLVFTQIMDRALGDIDYTDAERLHENQGYDYQTATGETQAYHLPTEFLLAVQAPAAEAQSAAEPAADEGEDDDLSVSQARMVAAKIKALTAEGSSARLYTKAAGADLTSHQRPVKYSDITLLTRSRTNNLTLQQVFAEADIPIVVTKTQNFFKTTELMVMLSLLRIIDNPKQEIPLTAVLRSPIVGLDANDLARIRIAAKGPYDEACFSYAQRADSSVPAENALRDKLVGFTRLLEELRVYARTHELSALIWHIYEETGFLDIVGSQTGGRQRQANLRALAKRAADYEKGGFKGLFAFVQFIETMQKQDKDLSQPVSLAANVNAVQLMTIHNSKGLQFPIVFLLDTQKAFNTSDLSGAAILAQSPSAEAGGPKRELVGLKWRDPQTFVEYQLPQWQLAKDQKKKQLWAEEMRLLYVALTRAEQQLFIVGTAKSPKGKLLTQEELATSWLKKVEGAERDVLPVATRLGAQSVLDWLGMAMARAGVLDGGAPKASLAQDAEKADVKFDCQVDPQLPESASQTPEAASEALPAGFTQALDDWLAFDYADQAAATTTGFQSVTELKRMFEDPDVSDAQDSSPRSQGSRLTADFAKPTFLETHDRASGAAVGTATHLLLQQVPLAGPHDEDTLAALADTLAEKRLITPAVRQAMRLDRVAAFFKTALGRKLTAAPDKVHREQAFSLLWPAADFPQPAQAQKRTGHLEGDVLVHGVIDGFIEEPTGITLFDYKTDHIGNQLAAVVDRYQGQLEVYARALTLMTHQPVLHRYLVLLETGDVHEVPAAKRTPQ